jgi:alpha-galactosidase
MPAMTRFVLLLALGTGLPALAQTNVAPVPPEPTTVALAHAAIDKPPFTFTYGGKEAATLLPSWTRSEAEVTTPAGIRVHQVTYRDPATKLKMVVEFRRFADFPAVDWVLYFTNEGTGDTPILENILPLHTTLACDSPEAHVQTTCGSAQSREDFALQDFPLAPNAPYTWGAGSGRSSDALGSNGGHGAFPFFNVQTGDHGTFVAIGWTGSWQATVNRAADGKSIALDAGMLKTHLLLHPGETIRTPRILLMDWKGDLEDAHNAWRRLMLAHYSPRDEKGRVVTVPGFWNTWGTEREATKVDTAKKLHELGIPADAYWMDAGWYEPLSLPPGVGSSGGSDWSGHRGNWVASKDLYPDGLRPVGEALKAGGIGFMVWFEAETASPDAPWVKEHPDWYFTVSGHDPTDGGWPHFLNLGNPAAYNAILTQISKFITDNELTWYRQDFNFTPAPYWAAADAPDRVGMSEIKSITGLYAFWDALRAQHPGLQIDNCSSGGRRIDLETITRAVPLWRSDAAGEPMGEQFHNEGLMPWVPLSGGAWIPGGDKLDSPASIFRRRCSYAAGLVACIGPVVTPEMKPPFAEFREVRPYFYGDYYPLQPQKDDLSVWSAWQLDRPEKGDGLIICLRRPNSIYCSLQVDLRKIDPAAKYEVEVRTTVDRAPVKTISGADFAHFQVTVPDMPGSALVFYHKK